MVRERGAPAWSCPTGAAPSTPPPEAARQAQRAGVGVTVRTCVCCFSQQEAESINGVAPISASSRRALRARTGGSGWFRAPEKPLDYEASSPKLRRPGRYALWVKLSVAKGRARIEWRRAARDPDTRRAPVLQHARCLIDLLPQSIPLLLEGTAKHRLARAGVGPRARPGPSPVSLGTVRRCSPLASATNPAVGQLADEVRGRSSRTKSAARSNHGVDRCCTQCRTNGCKSIVSAHSHSSPPSSRSATTG